jgi:hypothetical protein
MFIAREPRFVVRSDAVHIWRRHRGGEVDISVLCALEKTRQEITGTFDAIAVNNRIKRVEPFLGLSWVSVRELMH